MIDVCLCTHNPRQEILKKVLASIRDQQVDRGAYRFLIVDNASVPPLDESLLDDFSRSGIEARMVREPTPGIARARLRAIGETEGEWLLFVDDDNELMLNYISEGRKFASMHEDVGCFGGKLVLASELRPADWVEPFLPYLAIKDAGEESIFGKCSTWGPWEPPTAGAFVKRAVLELYKQRADSDSSIFRLGRSGRKNLSSCEDSLIMRAAFSLNLSNAYYPKLVLHHHLDSRRFNFNYLVRLMYAYGASHVILESIINGVQPVPDAYSKGAQFIRLLLAAAKEGAKRSIAFGVGLSAYHLGVRVEHFRQSPNHK